MKNGKSKLDLFLQIERRIDAGQTKIGNNSQVGHLEVKTNKLVWERNLVDGYDVSIVDHSSKNGETLHYSFDGNPGAFNIDDKEFCQDEIIHGENDKIKYLFKTYNLEKRDKENIIELAERYGNIVIANIEKEKERDVSDMSDSMKRNLYHVVEEVLDLASDKKFQSVVKDCVKDMAESHISIWLKEDGSYDNIENISAKQLEQKLEFEHDDSCDLEIVASKMFGEYDPDLLTEQQANCFEDLFHKLIVDDFKKQNSQRYKHPAEVFEKQVIDKELNIKQRSKNLDAILEDLPESNLKYIANEFCKKTNLEIMNENIHFEPANFQDSLNFPLIEILPEKIRSFVSNELSEINSKIQVLFDKNVDKTDLIHYIDDCALGINKLENSVISFSIANLIDEQISDDFSLETRNQVEFAKINYIKNLQEIGINDEILENSSQRLNIFHPRLKEIEPISISQKNKDMEMNM